MTDIFVIGILCSVQCTNSHTSKYKEVFKQVNLSLIQTTLQSPLRQTPLEYHKTFINPDSLTSLQSSSTQPIRIKPAASLCLYSLYMYIKGFSSFKSLCTLKAPLPHPTITKFQIQVINKVVPLCGVRSKVKLTVSMGF